LAKPHGQGFIAAIKTNDAEKVIVILLARSSLVDLPEAAAELREHYVETPEARTKGAQSSRLIAATDANVAPP
jgi:hypothetical protein